MDFFPLVKAIYAQIPNITADEIKDMQRTFAKEKKMKDLPSKSQILQSYFSAVKEWKLEKNQTFEMLLRKRAIRSLSWIVPVQVLTKPWPCPGQCIFCPNDPWMPKSYIKSEPGAMRAWLNQFDPMKQVYNRLQSLTTTGHQTDKIEMIILGWSWDAYPRDYKIDFVKQLYDACNTFSELKIKQNLWWEGEDNSKYHFEIENLDKINYSSSLKEAIKRNETAKNRIIWLTIETRPDLVSHENCKFWRELGVTRVEMWIQSTNDEVLKLNKRWHNVQKIKDAIHIMRQYGLKISIHLMPWLYGSNFEKDIQSFKDIYSNPSFQPDEIKFYPTSVIPNTVLYELYKEWKYAPITTEQILSEIRETFLNIIPPYTRIKRLIRDIPATEIVAWSNITNLSQMAHESLLKEMRASYWWKWSIDVERFYSRLYGEYELYEGVDEYFLKHVISNECGQKRPPFDKGGGEWNEPEGYNLVKNKNVDIYKKNFLAYNPSLLEKAKELKQNMTKAEKRLWYDFLQPLDIKVLRQQPIDEYIVDFYIASKKLVIEVDWDTHWTNDELKYDKIRTQILNALWLRVIRFTNDEVLNNFESVCGEINQLILDIPPLSPLVKGGQCIQIIWTQPDLKSFRNFVCLDTRSREVRNRVEKKKTDFLNLVLRWYKSSVGQECFISFEDELGYLYWFTRLLLPSDSNVVWIAWLEKWTAIIRELHVYGELQKIWEKSDQWTQHTWLWKRLLWFAEKLSESFGYNQFSVISWIWVREYYKNLWFELKWTYMSKKI